jgi:8-oxo-dGTP diphosphatase
MQKVVVAIIGRVESDRVPRYLLIQAKKDFGQYTGCYYPPGGHVEVGETEEQALVREINEELQVEVKPICKIDETPSDMPNRITAWWQCEIISGEMKLQTDEISDARFVSLEELQELPLWPATKKFFDAYGSQLG